MRLIKRLLLVAPLTILLSTCSNPSAPTTSSEISLYFPLHIGDTWTYDRNMPGEYAYIERRIISTVYDTDGSLLYGYNEDLQTYNPPPNLPITAYYSVHGGTAYIYYPTGDSSAGHALYSRVPLLKEPLTVGNKWALSENSLDSFSIVSSGQVNFNGLPVYAVVVMEKSQREIDSSWYAQGIGFLRQRAITIPDSLHWNYDLDSYHLVQ